MRDTFEHVITRNSERLIDDWRRDGHVDLVKQFTQKLPISVILGCSWLGSRYEAHFSCLV